MPDIEVTSHAADVGLVTDSLATLAPLLIVEVMSQSSEDRDLYVKPSEYLELSSLQAYIIASQNEAACLVYVRGHDGRFPDEPTSLVGIDKIIDIPALSLSIRLEDIYRGLSFPASADKTS